MPTVCRIRNDGAVPATNIDLGGSTLTILLIGFEAKFNEIASDQFTTEEFYLVREFWRYRTFATGFGNKNSIVIGANKFESRIFTFLVSQHLDSRDTRAFFPVDQFTTEKFYLLREY